RTWRRGRGAAAGCRTPPWGTAVLPRTRLRYDGLRAGGAKALRQVPDLPGHRAVGVPDRGPPGGAAAARDDDPSNGPLHDARPGARHPARTRLDRLRRGVGRTAA